MPSGKQARRRKGDYQGSTISRQKGIILTRMRGARECQKEVRPQSRKTDGASGCSAQGGIALTRRKLQDEIDAVLTRVLPLVPKDKAIEKKQFEVILNEILTCLHENTKIDIDVIAQKTPKVITDVPNEFGQLPEDARSWELMIGYLYAKYLKELGRL